MNILKAYEDALTTYRNSWFSIAMSHPPFICDFSRQSAFNINKQKNLYQKMPDEAIQKQRNLEEARENDQQQKDSSNLKKGINKAKNVAGGAKKMASSVKNAFTIASQVKTSDIVYALALIAAVFKDMLDFLQASGILYFFVVIFTILIFIFIFFMVLLGGFMDGGGGIGQAISIYKQLTIMGGFLTEMLFGINFLPVTTTSVFLLYYMTLVNRKNAKEKD